jgi:hypothetical protein
VERVQAKHVQLLLRLAWCRWRLEAAAGRVSTHWRTFAVYKRGTFSRGARRRMVPLLHVMLADGSTSFFAVLCLFNKE